MQRARGLRAVHRGRVPARLAAGQPADSGGHSLQTSGTKSREVDTSSLVLIISLTGMLTISHTGTHAEKLIQSSRRSRLLPYNTSPVTGSLYSKLADSNSATASARSRTGGCPVSGAGVG